MSTPPGCKHHNSVKWNPFKMAVLCETCGEEFFRAVHTDEGYILRSCEHLAPDSDKLIAALAEEIFRTVRPGGEMNAVERPLFCKMSRRAVEYLLERAMLAKRKET